MDPAAPLKPNVKIAAIALVGLALIIIGLAAGDEAVKQLGIGALSGSVLGYVVPGGAAVRYEAGEPEDLGTTTLGRDPDDV